MNGLIQLAKADAGAAAALEDLNEGWAKVCSSP